jgi:EAL domain-containing protein (putative c-di-GMP-specific phosphodiesterase class I)
MSALDLTMRNCLNACMPAQHRKPESHGFIVPFDAFEARKVAKELAAHTGNAAYYYVMGQVFASIAAQKTKARIMVEDMKRLLEMSSKDFHSLRCLLLDTETGCFDVTDEYLNGGQLTWVVSWA